MRYRHTLRRGAVLTMLACANLMCDNTRTSPAVQTFITYLETDTLGSLRPGAADAECGSMLLAGHIGYSGIGEQCSHRVADSLFYVYRSPDGELLIRGKRVLLAAERVSPFLDSLRTAIAQHFGKPTNCRSYDPSDPYYSRLDLWHMNSYTIFLSKSVITDTSSLRPGITVESAKGIRSCALMTGGPWQPL